MCTTYWWLGALFRPLKVTSSLHRPEFVIKLPWLAKKAPVVSFLLMGLFYAQRNYRGDGGILWWMIACWLTKCFRKEFKRFFESGSFRLKVVDRLSKDGFRIVLNTTNMDIRSTERTTERNPGHLSWNLVWEGMRRLSLKCFVLAWGDEFACFICQLYTLSNISESWKSAARLT